MINWILNKPLRVTAVIAAVTSFAVASVVAVAAAPDDPPPAPAPVADQAPVNAAPSSAAKSFDVLDGPQARGDSLPASLQKTFAESDMADSNLYGANLALAHRANGSTWVVPAKGGVCMVLTDPKDASSPPALACQPAGNAADGDLVATIEGDGGDTVVGMAPDGVDKVTLMGDDGQEAVPVRDNVYESDASAVDQVQFSDASGDHHQVRVP